MKIKNVSFKKSIYSLLTLLITIALIEIISIPIFYYLNSKSLAKKTIHEHLLYLKSQNKIQSVSAFDISKNAAKKDVLHPYFGFVKDYDLKEINYNDEILTPINTYGFLGEYSDDVKTFNIAIFGGSVAQELYLYSKKTLLKELQNLAKSEGKKIKITSIALGGMKQPQQLMALNYFLSIGQTFNMVINLDGYNEIVLPICENIPYGVAPEYPRSYYGYTTKSIDTEMSYYISEIMRSKMRSINYGIYLNSSILKESHFVLNLWLLFYENGTQKRADLDAKLKNVILERHESKGLTAQEKGPQFGFPNKEEAFAWTTKLWANSSLLMHQLCKQNNIKYFHFLQPNQYVKGSKIFTDWENRNVFGSDEYCYGITAEEGYPYLIKFGNELKKKGIDFYDLTGLFETISKGIYKDKCCHINQLGNDILARKIVEIVTIN